MTLAMQSGSSNKAGGHFPTTRWKLVDEVRSGGESGAEALEKLCLGKRYRGRLEEAVAEQLERAECVGGELC